MSFTSVANPQQLAMLSAVLEEHCRRQGFAKDSTEREDAGSFIMLLFTNGVQSSEKLERALNVRHKGSQVGRARRSEKPRHDETLPGIASPTQG